MTNQQSYVRAQMRKLYGGDKVRERHAFALFEHLNAEPVKATNTNIVTGFYGGTGPTTLKRKWQLLPAIQRYAWLLRDKNTDELMIMLDERECDGIRAERCGFSEEAMPRSIYLGEPQYVLYRHKVREERRFCCTPSNADEIPGWWRAQRDLRATVLLFDHENANPEPSRTHIVAGGEPQTSDGPPVLLSVVDVLLRVFRTEKCIPTDVLNAAIQQIDLMHGRTSPNEAVADPSWI